MKAQEGHKGEVKAQGEHGEDANSAHEESHVSNRHMTWWRNAWWVRMDNGRHLRTARGRRRVRRAATRAAREAHETEQVAVGERETWEQETTERTGRKESNTLHVVFHFPRATETRQSLQQVQPQQQQQPQQHRQQHLNAYDSNDSEPEYILVKPEDELLQPYRLPSSLATGRHRCRICCSWTSLLCQWIWRQWVMPRRSSSNATPFSHEEGTDVHDVH